MSARRAVLAAAAASVAAAATPATASAPPPARLQVVAKEYSLALSRPRIPSGRALIELANFGEDPHDLRLRRVGGTVTRSIPVVEAGDQRELAAKLLPGTYTLWCSLADHRARGMRARLVVVRRR